MSEEQNELENDASDDRATPAECIIGALDRESDLLVERARFYSNDTSRDWDEAKTGHLVIARAVSMVGWGIVKMMPVCVDLWWEHKRRYDKEREK